MKQCFACGEKIYSDVPIHPPCGKKVFGVSYLPLVDITDADVSATASEKTETPENPGESKQGPGPFSISDVQKELPLWFNRRFKELEKGGHRSPYTLKLPVEEIEGLPENQNLSLNIASVVGISVPYHALVKRKDNENTCLVVRRFDLRKHWKIRWKNFTRVLEKTNKHDATLEEIGEKILRISEVPGLDVQLFFEMVMLSYIIGCSDLHLDKFAITYNEKRRVRMAPLLDVVSTKLFRENEEELSLPMLGKTNDLSGEDFAAFARHLKIPPKAYDKMFLRFYGGKRKIGRLIKLSQLGMDEKIRYSDIVNERFRRLMS